MPTSLYRSSLVLLIALMGPVMFPQATRADASSTAFVKINDFYVLYTQPVAPYLDVKGVLMAPLGQLAALLGGSVVYGANDASASVNANGHKITFTIGSDTAQTDAGELRIAAAPTRHKQSEAILIPMAALVRGLAIPCSWESKAHVLHIQYPAALADEEDYVLHSALTAVTPDPSLWPIGFRAKVSEIRRDNKQWDFSVELHNGGDQPLVNDTEVIVRYVVPAGKNGDAFFGPSVGLALGDFAPGKLITIHPGRNYYYHNRDIVPPNTDGIGSIIVLCASMSPSEQKWVESIKPRSKP